MMRPCRANSKYSPMKAMKMREMFHQYPTRMGRMFRSSLREKRKTTRWWSTSVLLYLGFHRRVVCPSEVIIAVAGAPDACQRLPSRQGRLHPGIRALIESVEPELPELVDEELPDPFEEREVSVQDAMAQGSAVRREASTLHALGVDRQLLIALQRACSFSAAYYAIKNAEVRGSVESARSDVFQLIRAGVIEKRRHIDALIQNSINFELINGLLYRRVYDIQDDET